MPHTTLWKSILVLFSHLRLSLPNDPFMSGFSKNPVCTLFVCSAGGLLSAVIRLLVFVAKYPWWCIKSQMCFYSIIYHTHKLNIFLSTTFGFEFQPFSGHYTSTDLLLYFSSGMTMERIQEPELFARISTSILCVWLNVEWNTKCAFDPCCTTSIHIMMFGNANGFCFILHRFCVIKQWYANSGRPATGAPEIIWQLSTISPMQFEIQQNAPFPYAGYLDRPGTLGREFNRITLPFTFPGIVSRTVQCYGV
jgi:hypothetical protein